ncbi:MAG: hypothetical protein Q7R40_13815 [Phaeospirillum sp.]|nr:hypothetical protein [Phaeospirillum sp.]
MACGVKIVLGESAGLPGGQAAVTIIGLQLSVPPAAVRFVIAEDCFQGRYLSPQGWNAAVDWLIPELVDATSNRVNLVMRGDLVALIPPGAPLKFGLSFDGQSLVTTARFFWPSAAETGPAPSPSTGYAPPQTAYPQQPTAYPQAPPPPPVMPEASVHAASLPAAPRATAIFGDRRVRIAAAAVLVLAAGGGGAAIMSASSSGPGTAKPTVAASLPPGSPAEMFARGNDLRNKGQAGDAFLIFREAARSGHAPSAVAVGRMYDPVVFGQEPSPFSVANPAKAVEWYKQAQDLGNTEATQRFAQLVEWLKTRAQANDAAATEILAGLRQ